MAVYCKSSIFNNATAPPPGKEIEEYTIELIFKTTDTGYSPFALNALPLFMCQQDNYYHNNPSVMIGVDAGSLILWFYNDWVYLGYVSDNKYHKVVCLRKNKTTYLYLDGKLEISNNTHGDFSSRVPQLPNSNVCINWNDYAGQTSSLYDINGHTFNLQYFKLYDKALNENEFFKNISYPPLYSIPGIFKYIKKDSDLYLKDWSGNNNDFKLYKPTNCKSDIIISNLSFKE